MEAVEIRQNLLIAILFLFATNVVAQNQASDTIVAEVEVYDDSVVQNQTVVPEQTSPQSVDISGYWSLKNRTFLLAHPPFFRHSPIMLDDKYIDYASLEVFFNQYILEEEVHYFLNRDYNILYLNFRPEITDSIVVRYNTIPMSLEPIYSLDSSVIKRDTDFFAVEEKPDIHPQTENVEREKLTVEGHKGFYIDADASGFDISQDIEIQVEGKISDSTSLYAYIYESRSDNRLYAQTQFQDLERIEIRISDPQYEINAGDIDIVRGEKDLTYFSRHLRGIDAFYRFNRYRGSFFTGYRRFERYTTEIYPIQGITGPYRIDGSGFRIHNIKVFHAGRVLEEDKDYRIDRVTNEIYFSSKFVPSLGVPIVVEYSRDDDLNFRFNTGITGGIYGIYDIFSAQLSWYNDYAFKPTERMLDRISDTIAVYEFLNQTAVLDVHSRVSGAYIQRMRRVSGVDSIYYVFYPLNQIRAMGIDTVYFPEFYRVEPGMGDYVRDAHLSSLHFTDVYRFDITSFSANYRLGRKRYVPVDRNIIIPSVRVNADSIIVAKYSHGILIKGGEEDVSTGRYFDASLNITEEHFGDINSAITGLTLYAVNHKHSPGFSTLDTWKDRRYFFENWHITEHEFNIIGGAGNSFNETYFGISPQIGVLGFDINIGEYRNVGYERGDMRIDRFNVEGDYRVDGSRYLNIDYTFWRNKYGRNEFTRNRLRLNSSYDLHERVSVSPYTSIFYGGNYESDTTFALFNVGSNAVFDISRGWGGKVIGDYRLERIYWQRDRIDHQLDTMATITKGGSIFYNSSNNSFETSYATTEARRYMQIDNFYNFNSFYSHRNNSFTSRAQFSRETMFDRLMFPEYLWVGRNNGNFIFNSATGVFEYAGDNNGDFIRSEKNFQTTDRIVTGKNFSFDINFDTYVAPYFNIRLYESSNMPNFFPALATYENSRERVTLITEINPAIVLSPRHNPLKLSYYSYTAFNRYYEVEFDLTREALLENDIRYLRDFFQQQIVITQDNNSFVRMDKEVNVDDVAYTNFHFGQSRYFSRKNLIVAIDTIYSITRDEAGVRVLIDSFDLFKFPIGSVVSRNVEDMTQSLYYLYSINFGVKYAHRNLGNISVENFVNYRRDDVDNDPHAFFHQGYKEGFNYDMKINGGMNITDRLIFNTWYNMKIRTGERLWHQLALDLRYYF